MARYRIIETGATHATRTWTVAVGRLGGKARPADRRRARRGDRRERRADTGTVHRPAQDREAARQGPRPRRGIERRLLRGGLRKSRPRQGALPLALLQGAVPGAQGRKTA